MTVRAVEWKKPYTWGVAIEVTEDKVINLRLRDENNLIIWDEEDNEIYVDLQLWDEITPTDDFPVWITTGRAIVDNWWDATGTLVCFKTTSGDNIKLFYTDSGSVFVDNGTWTFKQIYLKSEVDALLATKQNLLTAWDNITIDSNNVISADKGIVVSNTQPSDATEWLLWYNTVTDQLKVYDWTDWNWIWWWGGSTYTAWHWINIDANDEISNTLPFEPTNTWTAGQVLKLDSNWDYWWDNESWWGSDIEYVTRAEYVALLPWAASDGKNYFVYQTDSGWQPWANTVFYAPFDVDLNDEVNWTSPTVTGTANVVNWVAELQWAWLVYPTITSPNSNRTVCFWCNMTQPATYNGRFTTWNWWTTDMYRRDSSYVWMYWNQEQPDQWTAELNTWIMWTYTQNWNSWTLYKNGIAKAYNVYPPTSSAEVHIWNPYTDDGFYGYMSKFIVEDKTWTAQEVLTYYSQTSWDYQ